MLIEIHCIIRGAAPLLMHNVRLADPLDPIVKQIKEISAKKTKTDTEIIRRLELEFHGGLYINERGPYIPAEWIEGVIQAGARLVRKGEAVKSGMQVMDDAIPLLYDGPHNAEGLFLDQKFVDKRMVGVDRKKVLRFRPRFDLWAAEFSLMLADDIVSVVDIKSFLEQGGRMKGIGDYRPKFGRFIVTSFEPKK